MIKKKNVIYFFYILLAAGLMTAALLFPKKQCNYNFEYKKNIHPVFRDRKFKDVMDRAENGYAPILIEGKIINKYRDECNHGIGYLDFITYNYYLFITPSSMTTTRNDSEMDRFTEVGDSIFKPMNSLIFTIKKEDTIAFFGFGTNKALLKDTIKR